MLGNIMTSTILGKNKGAYQSFHVAPCGYRNNKLALRWCKANLIPTFSDLLLQMTVIQVLTDFTQFFRT